MEERSRWSYGEWAAKMTGKYGQGVDARGIASFVFDRDMLGFEAKLDRILEDRHAYRAAAMRVRLSRWWDSVFDGSLAEDFYYWILRTWDRLVKDPIFEFRMRLQRARRGFSERDVWNVDTWISTVLPDALDRLADTAHGYPSMVEALSKGEDPKTYKYAESTSEEDGERYMSWWRGHLREIAFLLRESNEDTCSRRNELEYAGKHHFEECDDFPFCYRMVDDCTEEEAENNRRYFEREHELAEYRNDCYVKAMAALTQLHGALWD